MIRLHTFSSLFESSSISLTPEQVAFLDKHVTGPWKINSSTGLVDVDREVWFNHEKTGSIPVRFGNVGGDFNCSNNQLTSLVGAPQKVGGDFDCSSNKLTSLEGAPQKVGGSFDCKWNKLTSLVGAPQKVGVSFDCSFNKLTSLVGAPQKVRGSFVCHEFFYIPKGKWGIEGWMDVLVTGDEKARSLISTILSPSDINKEMEKNPEEMLMRLKGVWNSPEFANIKKGIKIPEKYKGEIETLADLSDLGF